MSKKLMSKQVDLNISNTLLILWKESFFSKSRKLIEISNEIATKGFHFSTSSLSTSLLRLIRSGRFLSRLKKSGRWEYIQKLPPSSLLDTRNKFIAKYEFHPMIQKVSGKQLKDGNFKEAIQNALVEVIDQVKIKTEYPKSANGRELDGDDLMNRVFGCDNQEPKIKFNDLKTGLDRAEQRGIMNLFKGKKEEKKDEQKQDKD